MTKVTQRSVVSSENYAEVKTMMLSNDEGSRNLALTIMEQSDYKESEIFILCLLKETFSSIYGDHGPYRDFQEKYPVLYNNIHTRLKESATEISTLSFRRVYELATQRGNKEEISFMLQLFKEELFTLLGEYGFTFLDFLDIEIKPKKNDD